MTKLIDPVEVERYKRDSEWLSILLALLVVMATITLPLVVISTIFGAEEMTYWLADLVA